MADPTAPPLVLPDVDRGPEILRLTCSLISLTLLVVITRIWVRARMIRLVGWDDYCILAAMTILLVELIFIVLSVYNGAGRHMAYIDPQTNIPKGLYYNFVTQPMCLIALCLTKVSAGLFLHRLASTKMYKKIIIAITVFTVLCATASTLMILLACRPLNLNWDRTAVGECMPPTHMRFAAFFGSSLAVFTDFLFAILPVPMFWQVKLNWKVKSAVAGILSLGVFATAAGIVKITFLSDYGKFGDLLYDSTDLTIWTTAEICTAIIATSIPCLKPLFRRILRGSSAAKYYHRNDGDKNVNSHYGRSGGGGGGGTGHGNSKKSSKHHLHTSVLHKSGSSSGGGGGGHGSHININSSEEDLEMFSIPAWSSAGTSKGGKGGAVVVGTAISSGKDGRHRGDRSDDEESILPKQPGAAYKGDDVRSLNGGGSGGGGGIVVKKTMHMSVSSA
ncbi:hypothetical protein MN608_03305 [Microdochium nivale]|nr:hypothetical protein MN608_03305 [Microdochium nivale]